MSPEEAAGQGASAIVPSSLHEGRKAKRVAVIGGGPAGLMAAEVLSAGGARVEVYDGMPSVGRKFLLAGRGGLNLTHAEDEAAFLTRYFARSKDLAPLLEQFGARDLRQWTHGLGIDTFVGSSQRVFPTEMKAAPLLRAWLHRLRAAGVAFKVRHRWQGWDESGGLCFTHAQRQLIVKPDACVLALGGASWSRLGSDGAWAPLLQSRGVPVTALLAANCGFDKLGGWSEHLRARFAGQPVKPVALSIVDSKGQSFSRQGEFVLTDTGIEGSLVYAASSLLRDEIVATGEAVIFLDLLPDRSQASIAQALATGRGAKSLSNHLRSRLGLVGLKAALLHECADKAVLNDPVQLASLLKRFPLTLNAARPIDEAISTAGGVPFEVMSPGLMLNALPGVFCAGEMLDWEAPTGGYLLTACCSSGRAAALGVLDWLG